MNLRGKTTNESKYQKKGTEDQAGSEIASAYVHVGRSQYDVRPCSRGKPCYDDDVITACLKALCADEYDAALALAEDKARKRRNEREAAAIRAYADLQSENGGGAVC